MRSRTLLAALAAALALALAAGCGGGDSGGSKVAELAPPGVPIFAEGVLRPEGELKTNADAIAKKLGAEDSLAGLIASQLEDSAREDGEKVDFATEIEPWLGEHGGLFFRELDDENDPTGLGMIVESTDPAATEKFIADHKSGDRKVGVVGDFLLVAEDDKTYKEMVTASEGDSLADEDTFQKAIGNASEGSLIDVYVDAGRLFDLSEGRIDPNLRKALRNAGLDPSEATAVASVVPQEDRIVVELSSDLAGQEAPTGDASGLLGEMPADAFAAVALSDFGDQVKEALDGLDEEGVPGTIPPNQLKKGFKQVGIDLEAFADSLEDGAVFASGSTEQQLGGALVLSTKGSSATETVANIGELLQQGVSIKGVSPLKGKFSGFSVRSEDLGDKPLVVASKDGRVAIGYGLKPTIEGLTTGSGNSRTLSDVPAYEAAVEALGETPISGFADGPAALRLADSLIPSDDDEFRQAKKYLRNVEFLALGSLAQDDVATARLIVGLK